ncbi:MAG: hypothetical protein ACRENP_14265 [Longimicrobiales bacterium]
MEVASVLKWVGLFLLVAAGLACSIYLYRLRETPGRGRFLLALLRGFAIAVLLLLLFDPMLPTAARTPSRGTVIVLDASISMELPLAGGGTRWNEALQRAQRVPDASIILLAGGSPRRISRDSLASITPSYGASRLLPALLAASESGARKVVVITDGAIEDAQEVQRWLPRLGLEVEVQSVGGQTPTDRGIQEVTAPIWAEAGKPIDVSVGITSNANANLPQRVMVHADGNELGSATLATPAAGRVSTGTIKVTPSAAAAGRLVRLDVSLEGQDAIPANDRRSIYVLVGAKPTGVALVSFEPDWEPRFLQPVLEQSTGLPVRSFYRTGGNVYVTGGIGTELGKRAFEEEVQRSVREADLVVLHGVGDNSPTWAREASQTRPRVLIMPRENGASLNSVQASAAAPGDWYITTDVPPSPIAGLLAGMPVQNLPPLLALHLARDIPSGAWVPLQATRGRRGAPAPVALAIAEAGRRRVISLGQGYWRWSFRGGDARNVYVRFWGALAGWLVQEQTQVAGGAIRPARRVVQRGERLVWITPGLAADSISLSLIRDTARTDLTIPVEAGDSASSSPLAPGHYRYEARAFSGGRVVGTGTGPLTVEPFSMELVRAARPLDDLKGTASSALGRRGRGGERPLRTSIWPYALILALLTAEWVLRRRWGLR